eukprot:jgi/Tetstr1/420415/TSEL_011530.t1
MEHFYYVCFAALTAISGLLEFTRRGEAKAIVQPEFRRFRANYILVYSLMMAGDWLQGPYVYALYQHYGFSRGDIGRLFIAGFGSSLLFGTIVGSLADKHGRKAAALTYCATYCASCLTKHWNNYNVLLLGRVLGGIATSLLWSAFESWLVSEHLTRGYDPDWLGSTFSKAVYLGNGLMAIVSGLAANTLVEALHAGFTSPFDAAGAVLLAGAALIASSWTENYGDGAEQGGVFTQIRNAAAVILSDRKVALLGAMQGLFEGSMYTFVFLWTPALSPNDEHIPHGLIFRKYMQGVFLLAGVSLMVPVAVHREGRVAHGGYVRGGTSPEAATQMVAFCVFEATIGLFWPSMMKMRSQYVPDEKLSTIINCFRVPVNIFVCAILFNVSDMHLETVFAMCAFFLLVCAGLQRALAAEATAAPKASKPKGSPAVTPQPGGILPGFAGSGKAATARELSGGMATKLRDEIL